jgi:hypothetical protein
MAEIIENQGRGSRALLGVTALSGPEELTAVVGLTWFDVFTWFVSAL